MNLFVSSTYIQLNVALNVHECLFKNFVGFGFYKSL